jgi:hypothetical protein
MDPTLMRERCPSSPSAGVGWLRGWRITFGGEDHGWDGALPTIVPDEVGAVFVALYDIAGHDAAKLDDLESATTGLYRRLRLRVQTDDEVVPAWTYVLDAYEGGLPSLGTLTMLADAAEIAGAPDDYVAGLRNRPSTSV